ncbi:hypothetical protein HYC85_008789 [Camellia sinensis]|uniref:Uncharacterized protein n=1 Tax=Camellia sinensis TaxID=4442 RepID=A0A7J7HSV3_CAMSI|nr:hypothetical protein HYC85_008789 [Camellia sinensis]
MESGLGICEHINSLRERQPRGNLENLATARGHSPWNSLLDSPSLNTEVDVMEVVKWTRLLLALVPRTVLDLLNPSGR